MFFLPLTCFFLVTFPRNLAQTFRSDRSTYLQDVFFHSFYTFEATTNFVAEESFVNKYLDTLFGYNFWGLNTVISFSAEFSSFSSIWIMEIISLKSKARKMLTKQKDFILQRLIGTLSRMSVFTDFFINTILFYVS